jgi:hypothetical protein
MRLIFRRMLSSVVKELGAELPTSEVLEKKSIFKFFKLEEIYTFQEVLRAPEGSVVGINQVEPSSHAKGMNFVVLIINDPVSIYLCIK